MRRGTVPLSSHLGHQAHAFLLLHLLWFVVAQIYAPECHDALAKSVHDALRLEWGSTGSGAASASASSRVAYFTQANRNADTFAHFEGSFQQYGLCMESQSYEQLPLRFAYDRDCLQMQKITLAK